MKTGIQYVEGLSVKRALESGFANIELCMEDIDKLDDIKAWEWQNCWNKY